MGMSRDDTPGHHRSWALGHCRCVFKHKSQVCFANLNIRLQIPHCDVFVAVINYRACQDFNLDLCSDHVIAFLKEKRMRTWIRIFTSLSSPLRLSSPHQLRPDICTLTDVQHHTCCEKCCCSSQKGRRSLEQGGTGNCRPHRLCCYLRGD